MVPLQTDQPWLVSLWFPGGASPDSPMSPCQGIWIRPERARETETERDRDKQTSREPDQERENTGQRDTVRERAREGRTWMDTQTQAHTDPECQRVAEVLRRHGDTLRSRRRDGERKKHRQRGKDLKTAGNQQKTPWRWCRALIMGLLRPFVSSRPPGGLFVGLKTFSPKPRPRPRCLLRKGIAKFRAVSTVLAGHVPPKPGPGHRARASANNVTWLKPHGGTVATG